MMKTKIHLIILFVFSCSQLFSQVEYAAVPEKQQKELSRSLGYLQSVASGESKQIARLLPGLFQDQSMDAAKYTLGLMYQEGVGVTKNEHLAEQWMAQAKLADFNAVKAYYKFVAGDIKEAVQCLENVEAVHGESFSYTFSGNVRKALALIYFFGIGDHKDYNAFQGVISKLIEHENMMQDEANTVFLLAGQFAFWGLGEEGIDYSAARDFFIKALEKDSDSSLAHAYLGACNLYGLGGKQSVFQAVQDLNHAEGSILNRYYLGICAEKGFGMKADLAQAIHSFNQFLDEMAQYQPVQNLGYQVNAIDFLSSFARERNLYGLSSVSNLLGNLNTAGKDLLWDELPLVDSAYNHVGRCYLQMGQSDKAMEFFRQSAATGSSLGQYNLAMSLLSESSQPTVQEYAFSLLLQAAENEHPHPDAMLELSRRYRLGEGCQKNIQKADEWSKQYFDYIQKNVTQLTKEIETAPSSTDKAEIAWQNLLLEKRDSVLLKIKEIRREQLRKMRSEEIGRKYGIPSVSFEKIESSDGDVFFISEPITAAVFDSVLVASKHYSFTGKQPVFLEGKKATPYVTAFDNRQVEDFLIQLQKNSDRTLYYDVPGQILLRIPTLEELKSFCLQKEDLDAEYPCKNHWVKDEGYIVCQGQILRPAFFSRRYHYTSRALLRIVLGIMPFPEDLDEFLSNRYQIETIDYKNPQIIYGGKFSNGIYNGTVRYTMEEGIGIQSSDGIWFFAGEFEYGRYHGYGIYVFDNGFYAGMWKDGLKDGSGEYYWKDGSVYRGTWQNDMRHGNGIYTNANGIQYEMEYNEGTRIKMQQIIK